MNNKIDEKMNRYLGESMSEDDAYKKIDRYFKTKVAEGEVVNAEELAEKIQVPPRYIVTYLKSLVKDGYAEIDSEGDDESGWDTEYLITHKVK